MRVTTRSRSHQAGMPITNPNFENIGSEPQVDSRVQVADHSVVDVTVVSSGCCCWADEDPSSPHMFTTLDKRSIMRGCCRQIGGLLVRLSSHVLTHLSREIQGVPLAFELMTPLEYSISPWKHSKRRSRRKKTLE